MKKILLILIITFSFGCKNTNENTAPLKITSGTNLAMPEMDINCYKLIIQGSIYINSKGDTIEDYSGTVAYIPCNSDRLTIIDTVGYAKFLIRERLRIKNEQEQTLRVNI